MLTCAVWLWLLALQAQAQYRVDRWTTDDGLPQNSINSLVQTRDGCLWLTTNDGLVRFDGVRFTVFNKANTSAFFSNRLGFLHEDQSGRLWIYTEGGGLVRYENGSFTPTIKPGDPSLRIQSNLLDDGQGGIFFWSGTEHYHYQAGKFVPFTVPGLPAGKAIIYHDRDGGFWCADQSGFYRLYQLSFPGD